MNDIQQLTEEYLQRLSLSVEQNKALVTPLTASLQANKLCNSRCEYCGIWKNAAIDPTLEDLLLAVDNLAELGVHMISLTGGEPFLQRHLPAVVREISARGIISSTMTNGLLLRPKRTLTILEAGLNSLCVSLDTIDPETYMKIRGVPITPVLDGLRYISRIRRDYPSLMVFSINCVVSRANIDQLEPLLEFARELDISVGFQPLHDSFESRNNPRALHFDEEDRGHIQRRMEELLELKEVGFRIDNDWTYLQGFTDYLVCKRLPAGTTCTAGFTTIAIDAELNVRSCWPKRPVGNLHRERLTALWHSEAYNQARSAMLALDCPGCWLRCHTDYLSAEWLSNTLKKIARVKAQVAIGPVKAGAEPHYDCVS